MVLKNRKQSDIVLIFTKAKQNNFIWKFHNSNKYIIKINKQKNHRMGHDLCNGHAIPLHTENKENIERRGQNEKRSLSF